MSYWEILGFITGVFGVWLTAKGNILCWPVGIINVLIYTWIFYDVRLFGDMWLQVFYFGMAIAGWYQWKKVNTGNKFIVTRISRKQLSILLGAALISYIFLVMLLRKFNASLPLLDAFTTILSLAGTWLTIKKKIENWYTWIFVDLIYTGMYIYKDLYLTSLLYLIFTGLAVYGLIEWKKKIQ